MRAPHIHRNKNNMVNNKPNKPKATSLNYQ